MTHQFCTYFDAGYVSRALVLHESLVATGTDFRLTALCLDDEAFRRIQDVGASTLVPLRLAELEASDPDLAAVKGTRSTHEYYFTLGPSLMTYLLDQSENAHLTYLDADMCFYADPQPLFDESAGAATVIVGHRFPNRLRHLEETGRFNVAWVGFENDPDGRACLAWWRERCLDWCFDVVETTRYADQKYLDQFADRFARVHELAHAGADVAPWNVADPALDWDGQRFTVNDWPLVFFHFQGARMPSARTIDPNLAAYGNRSTPTVRRLYRGYARALLRAGGVLHSPRRSQADRSALRRLGHNVRGVSHGHLILLR